LESFPSQFQHSYMDFFSQVHNTFKKSVYHKRWDKFDPKSVNLEIEKLFSNQRRTYLDHMLSKLHNKQYLNSFLRSIPSLDGYLQVRHHLHNKLIHSELDKGKGLLYFCCQTIWASHTKRTFWDSHSHFLHCPDETIQSIEENFAKFYDDEELSSIAKFAKSGQSKGKSIPYLYIMAKLKDVNKVRPLASYFHHNLKYIYRYTSMALAVVLKKLDTLHFNVQNL